MKSARNNRGTVLATLMVIAPGASGAGAQTISLLQGCGLVGTFDGPNGMGSFPEIVRLADQQHFFYPTHGMPSTLPSQYTQVNTAGGGQTGGGFLDGVRVAECALKIGFSYSNAGPYPVIDTRLMNRTFLAEGYQVVGSMSTPASLSGRPIFAISGTGAIPFSTYQTGTPNFLHPSITAITGSIKGNTLMPGEYMLSVSFAGIIPSMNSSTPPGEITRDSTFRIVLGLAPCYANCDASIAIPLLTGNDFQCFLDKFAAGDTGANCDNSTGTPELTANDFQCFLDRFAAGCS